MHEIFKNNNVAIFIQTLNFAKLNEKCTYEAES